MKKAVFLASTLVAAIGVLYTLRDQPIRAQSATPAPPARDFYGEADSELDPPNLAPADMQCGSLSVDAGLTIQTVEPPQGFLGACLANRMPAQPPTVCFAPRNADYSSYYTAAGRTQCSIPANEVVQPYWYIYAGQDAGTVSRQTQTKYRSLVTCVPHGSCPNSPSPCPCNTMAVSNSCCTPPVEMTSSDGVTAVGTAAFAAH